MENFSSENISSILALWGIQDSDTQLLDLQTYGVSLGTPERAPPLSSCCSSDSTYSMGSGIDCSACGESNYASSNWCIECGKCLSETREDPFEDVDDECCNEKILLPDVTVKLEESSLKKIINTDITKYKCATTNQLDASEIEQQYSNISCLKSMRQAVLCDASQVRTGHSVSHSMRTSPLMKETRSHESGTTQQSKLKLPIKEKDFPGVHEHVPSKISKRKWPSSGFYMWRKQSSLKAPDLQVNNVIIGKAEVSYISSQNSETRIKNFGMNEYLMYGSPYRTEELALLSLPDELLLLILSHLSFNELSTCRRVCRRLYQLTFDICLKGNEVVLSGLLIGANLMRASNSYPSSLIMRKCLFHSNLSVRNIQSSTSILGEQLKSLTIDSCNLGSLGSDIFLQSISTDCPNLVSLHLEWIIINGTTLFHIMKNSTRIEELHLLDVSGLSSQSWGKAVVQLSQGPDCKLRTLRLKLRPEIPVPCILGERCFDSLRSLTFRQNMNKLKKPDIERLLAAAPNLSKIEIESIKLPEEVVKLFTERSIAIKL